MSEPPSYTEPLMQPGEGDAPRNSGDHVPDDFKWSDVVAECAINIRHAFIRKVYTILAAQILLTCVISGVIMFNETVNKWVLLHPWALYVSMFAAIGFMIAAHWKQKQYPINLVFLGLFTVSESYLIGLVSATYDTNVVIQAGLVTAVIFFSLSIFAVQTKWDLTGLAPYLFAALMGLIGFGLVTVFIPSSGAELAYSIIAVILFSGFVLVDTQQILTQFDPESEIPAAITLYLDIINLFLNLLRILGNSDDN